MRPWGVTWAPDPREALGGIVVMARTRDDGQWSDRMDS